MPSFLQDNDYILYSGSFTGLTADAMLLLKGLELGGGGSKMPLYKVMPDWKRIIIEFNITAITGTNVVFKAVTGVDPSQVLTASSVAAVKGDGSTAFNSATITTAGRYIMSMSREGASSAVSNIGAILGILADVTSLTVLAGSVTVLVTR